MVFTTCMDELMSTNNMNQGKASVVLFNEKNVVTQSNQLVEGNLTGRSINLNRLLYSVLSNINPNVPELLDATDQDVEEYYRYKAPDSCFFKIPVAQFLSFWRMDRQSFYSEIKDHCKALRKLEIDTTYINNRGLLKHRFINVIEDAAYDSELTDGIEMRLTPSVMPFMLNLHKRVMGYTKTPLVYLVYLNSLYSWKLLEILLQKSDMGELKIDIGTLRELFDCTDKYPKFYHFSKNVLEVAKKQIEAIEGEKAKINFVVNKKGRNIQSVTFTFSFPVFQEKKRLNKLKSATIPECKKELTGNDIIPIPQLAIQGPSKRMLEMMAESAEFIRHQESVAASSSNK